MSDPSREIPAGELADDLDEIDACEVDMSTDDLLDVEVERLVKGRAARHEDR